MIKAPYNFVPLNKEVVTPYWGGLISHDIPFKNAQSGSLEVEVEALSPIYVRNGVKGETPDIRFNQHDGKYFIPGTSIKGMLRSMVEIMSFGSMADRVDDVKYSVRDWGNSSIYPKSEISKEALAGWLRKEDGEYKLKPCGRPGRISHTNLDPLCGPVKMSKFYENKKEFKNNDEFKSAQGKYEKFPFEKQGYTFSLEDPNEPEDGINRAKYELDPAGKAKGTIVFTGQPGPRNADANKGKQYEFIFFEKGTQEIIVPEEVRKSFFYAYYDHEINQQKPDWKWRKKQLESGEAIPVFYREDRNGKIKDMGLTLLFKIAYNYSVGEVIENYQGKLSNRDFADLLFGFSDKDEALKSRVFISHAFAEGNPTELETQKEVLAGPKATYYPNYIEQDEYKGKVKVGNHSTLMEKNARIRGWKRYPLRTGELYHNPAPNKNEKITTQFKPLAKGSKFKFTIGYHNLRMEELGALISALTYHQTPGLYHAIGMAKPLGYGKVKLTILNKEKPEIEMYLKSFELFMNKALDHSKPEWHNTDQVVELFSMAKPLEDHKEVLNYMELKEFMRAKGTGKSDPKYALQKYSDLVSKIEVQTLITSAELETYSHQFEDDKEKFEAALSKDKSEFWFDKNLREAKEKAKARWGIRKKEILDSLYAKKEELVKEREIKRKLDDEKAKEERAQRKVAEGLDFSDIKENAKAFDAVAKKVTIFAEAYHGKKVDVLRAEGTPYLPLEEHRKVVVEKIARILPLTKKKEIMEWKAKPLKNNKNFKKMVNWFGEDGAIDVFEQLETYFN